MSNYEIFNDWNELDIPEDLLRGIYNYGFENPSSIQQKSILSIMKGKDVIAQSQSGTGKTGSFTIGALSRVNLNINNTQIIIISPTREISNQIYEVITKISCMMNNIKIYNLVGGNSVQDDIQYLKFNNPHIITGCIGRINDMIQRNLIHLDNLTTFIIDEVDEIFSNDFKHQIMDIFNQITNYKKNNIQYVFFSATMPESFNAMLNDLMKNPVHIIVKSECLTLEGISQYYIALNNDYEKYLVIKDLYSSITLSQSIIYCNSIGRVNELYENLIKDDFPVCRLHGNMTKDERNQSFNDFKKGKYRVLISSNITSRGIDIQQISIVINYDLPKCKHNYLHRIGRSGRFGKKGVSINLITKRDVPIMKEIEEHYNTEINELPINFNENL
jgi:translation initiation factor 4A